MILVNKFDINYDGTPLSLCQTTQVVVNEKRILFIYKQQSAHKEDDGMMYSVIGFDDATHIECKDYIGEFGSLVRFKFEQSDILINKDKVKILKNNGRNTIVIFNEKYWLTLFNKFDEVVRRLG